SKCMTCGVCLEACPNVNDKNGATFIGPAALSQARLFNAHPTGEMNKSERLDGLMETGGITGCGNAQNCVQVCQKGIPLTTSIAAMNRTTEVQSFKNFFGSDNEHELIYNKRALDELVEGFIFISKVKVIIPLYIYWYYNR